MKKSENVIALETLGFTVKVKKNSVVVIDDNGLRKVEVVRKQFDSLPLAELVQWVTGEMADTAYAEGYRDGQYLDTADQDS